MKVLGHLWLVAAGVFLGPAACVALSDARAHWRAWTADPPAQDQSPIGSCAGAPSPRSCRSTGRGRP